MKTKIKDKIRDKFKTKITTTTFLSTIAIHKAQSLPVSMFVNMFIILLSMLLISINVGANNANSDNINTVNRINDNAANNSVNNTINNNVNNGVNNINTNNAFKASSFVKTKTISTKSLLTDFDKQQQTKTDLKMHYLGLTQAEIILSENLKAIAFEMDKNNALSSLEILGMFATTQQDKNKYAHKFVASIRNYTAKVLEFQKYINQAHINISGSSSMFDYTPKTNPSLITEKRVAKTSRTERIAQTTRTSRTINLNDCDQVCESEIKQLVQMPLIVPVDLYFTDALNTQIQRWALKIGISHDLVDSGLITLNHSY